MQNHMTYALLQNAAGKFVAPSAASFQAAAASADWAHAKDFNLVMTNAPGAERLSDHRDHLHPDAPSSRRTRRKSDAALGFFRWALEKGQAQAQQARLRAAARRARPADRDATSAPTSSELPTRP